MRKRTKAILIVLASATLIAAAAGARHTSPRLPRGTNTIEITAREYGYAGPDTFSVQVTGKGPTATGTSIITLVATVR